MPDRKPRRCAAPDQEAVDPYRINQRDKRRVLDDANPAPLKVKDLEADKLGEEQELLIRHRERSE